MKRSGLGFGARLSLVPRPPSPAIIHPLTLLRAISNPGGYSYLVSQPPESSSESDRRWPLLFFLHGAAERGANPMDVARQGLPRLLRADGPTTPQETSVGNEIARSFIVVAPQCPHFEVWEERSLLAVLDSVFASLPIDLHRVYLTGLSMGAFGAWTLGLRNLSRFAALAPVCGGGRIVDILAAAAHHREQLLRTGVWAFHGARDRVVPLEESERMIAELHRAGVRDVKFTVYPEGDHDAWTQSYANPELYRWLLTHRR
jgi:predicted peptidase